MSDRDRSRRQLIKRTIYASGALFSVLFVLLSAQMVLGRDPALGSGRHGSSAAQTAQVRKSTGATHDRSVVDRVLSLATQALSGDGSSSSHAQTQQQQAPAPVQSTTS